MNIKEKGIILICTVATGSRKIRMILTPVVGLSYFLFSTVLVIVSLWIDHWFHLPPLPGAPVNIWLSVLFAGTGLTLALWCLYNFLKAKGTPVPFNPPPVLMTTGPYAYIRNPMLSGVFLLLFGLGFLFQSVTLLFVFTPLFILINVLELKAIEEPELAMRLGPAYLVYKERTPMFFPGLKGKASHD
ncbi:MAG: isoprenylcysteine carboxylmethyltransferase family protein [Deltaproteobacteria bacterium]|nr:isoprenylcysteine carboxylmethyltransferase family protein [Deltaproteobacteria bacterium]